jgi:hypothetical protein
MMPIFTHAADQAASRCIQYFIFMYLASFHEIDGGCVIRINKKGPTLAFPAAQSR